MTAPRSLYQVFLRLFLRIGIAVMLIVFAAAAAFNYQSMRRDLVLNVTHTARNIAYGYAFFTNRQAADDLSHYISGYRDYSWLMRLCIYDPENRLLTFWDRTAGRCPPFITRAGLQLEGAQVRHSLPVMRGRGIHRNGVSRGGADFT